MLDGKKKRVFENMGNKMVVFFLRLYHFEIVVLLKRLPAMTLRYDAWPCAGVDAGFAIHVRCINITTTGG